ncbi:MAG: hypothetical protein K2Y21_06580 [Phycisphaerales bacterium]|nr:hypothetical protein [Phycisphaerales bacterium]
MKIGAWTAAVLASAVGSLASAQAISFGSSKAENYLQTADGVVTPYNDWSCVLSISADTVDAFSDCSITYAGPLSPLGLGIVGNTAPYGQVWYGYSTLHSTLASLDAEIPPGDYEFSFTGNALPGGTHTFTLPPSTFCAETPELVSDTYSRLQTYKNDMSLDFIGQMSGFADVPGANASAVSFVVYDVGKGGLFWSASLPPTAISFTIPTGSLEVGRAYFGVMYYTVSFSSPGAGINGGSHASSFSKNVFFYFNTRGPCPADLNGDTFVDDEDFVLFAQAYNILLCSEIAMPDKCPADLTNQGTVDDEDFVVFAQAYDQLLCNPE